MSLKGNIKLYLRTIIPVLIIFLVLTEHTWHGIADYFSNPYTHTHIPSVIDHSPLSGAFHSTSKPTPIIKNSPSIIPIAHPPTLTPTPLPILTSTSPPTPIPTSIPPWQINNKLTCLNCTYAPIDKKNKLPATYTPQVIDTNLPGGKQLTSSTIQSLKSLFNNAKKQNINIKIVSGYRSYQTQQQTFNYWVQQEINKGYNRQTAENRANNYSAKPGHSEHQLGTTVDLACLNCNAFNNSARNQKVYNFLKNNAHKYGFVISYTAHTTQYTGYQYEPWHIRFIGTKLATELYNLGYLNNGSTIYLAKFLQII